MAQFQGCKGKEEQLKELETADEVMAALKVSRRKRRLATNSPKSCGRENGGVKAAKDKKKV